MGISPKYTKNVRCYKEILNDSNKKAIEKIQIIINDLIDIENEHNRLSHQDHKRIDKNNVVIGNIYERDGVVGCVEGIDGWYLYTFWDHTEEAFTGPFDLHAIIKALSCHLGIRIKVSFLRFTDEEERIYLNNFINYDNFWRERRKT